MLIEKLANRTAVSYGGNGACTWLTEARVSSRDLQRHVKHILIDCSDFRDIRNKYFVASTMKHVFEWVSMRNVINFIKETHFYNFL